MRGKLKNRPFRSSRSYRLVAMIFHIENDSFELLCSYSNKLAESSSNRMVINNLGLI